MYMYCNYVLYSTVFSCFWCIHFVGVFKLNLQVHWYWFVIIWSESQQTTRMGEELVRLSC